ncbi:MAG: signal recognition particle-docking protein FtsY [Halobacteriota archaeon]
MFESLRKKLKIFKESVSTEESELNSDTIGVLEDKATLLSDEDLDEASYEPTTPNVTNFEVVEHNSGDVKQVQQRVEPSNGRAPTQDKSFFERKIKTKDLEDSLWDLEMALLESDVAVSVTEEIVETVKKELVGTKRKWRQDVGTLVEKALRDGILKVLDVNGLDFDEIIKTAPKPVTIVFTGINGTGKTTTIAKVAYRLKNQGYSVVLAAGDTYRAGALEQIERHAEKLGVKLVKHQQGADPAAVIYDAVQYARAKHKDVVLADTAGRIHTNVNLMNQLRKIERVIDADLVVFVDEALAGNDAVERALQFNTAMAIDASILTKVDADSKGGTAISIAHATRKPILFLGIGQNYEDIVKFDPQWLMNRLFDEADA